jgi:hypothetical protein
MKRRYYILTILFAVTYIQVHGQTFNRDTIHYYYDTEYDTKNFIFIEHNRNSDKYQGISSFTFSRFDSINYEMSIDYLHSNNFVLTHITISDELPKKWILLNLYKSDYYVYYPCNFLYHHKVIIADTTYVDWRGEGPEANKIVSFQKIDNKTFVFKLAGYNRHNQELKIHIIDKTNGIAVFEEVLPDRENIFYLMISADKIRNMPIIVNECIGEIQDELDFDLPNFEELIRNE